MTDTTEPREADTFRPIRLKFYFQDFESLTEIRQENPAPYMRPVFHSVGLTLGIYDTENLIGDLGKAVGMPPEEIREVVDKFRVYTEKFRLPEEPAPF